MYAGQSDMQRMKGQGTPAVPNGPKDQNYSSFQNYTSPMTSSMAAAAASDPYMSSYYMPSTPYQAFGVGDGTWSNGGDHMQTFLGGYGGQMGFDSHNTAAIDGMFGGGSFGGFNNPPGFNYSFHNNGDYSAWGSSDVRGGTKYDDYYQRNVYADDRVKTIDQGVQGLNLSDPKPGQDVQKDVSGNRQPSANGSSDRYSGDSNSLGGETTVALSQPKKGLSWASVASQPAKPQPSRRRDKAAMPSIVPGRHMDIGTWEGKNGSGPKPVAPPPAPRPAWDAPRGGSRSSGATSYSTPPPRTPPQAPTAQSQPSSPQQVSQQPMQQPPPAALQQQQHQLPSQQQHQPSSQQQHQAHPHQTQQSSPSGPMLQGAGMLNEMSSSSPAGQLGHPTPVQPQMVPQRVKDKILDDLQMRNNYNPRDYDLDTKNARFFVIKSYSEDDIHRSIKYEIWCSTEHGNKRLDNAYREREGKGPVYLFFSVNGSGHFCGLAQMASCVDYNATSSVWAQDKWKGQFRVKWVYVKDVPNNQLRHIRLENNENKPVTNSRDTQEVPPEKGKQVLKIIHSFKHSTSLFDDFSHYEKRQEETEHRRGQQSFKDMDRDDRRHERGDFRERDHRDLREHRDQRDYHRGGPGGRGSRGSHHRGGGRN